MLVDRHGANGGTTAVVHSAMNEQMKRGTPGDFAYPPPTAVLVPSLAPSVALPQLELPHTVFLAALRWSPWIASLSLPWPEGRRCPAPRWPSDYAGEQAARCTASDHLPRCMGEVHGWLSSHRLIRRLYNTSLPVLVVAVKRWIERFERGSWLLSSPFLRH